jgi:hypothetical protein
VNQSGEKDILFEFVAPEKKVIVEQKGSKGMMYMAISAILFTMSAFFLKILYMNSEINTYEFTYWQSIFMAALNLILFKAADRDHMLVRDDMRSTLILRSIAAFLGATGFYLAL